MPNDKELSLEEVRLFASGFLPSDKDRFLCISFNLREMFSDSQKGIIEHKIQYASENWPREFWGVP